MGRFVTKSVTFRHFSRIIDFYVFRQETWHENGHFWQKCVKKGQFWRNGTFEEYYSQNGNDTP